MEQATSKKFGCPLCKSTQILENNIVHVRLKVAAFDDDGEPSEFAYPWREVDDTIRAASKDEDGVQRYYCDECGEEFDEVIEIQTAAA